MTMDEWAKQSALLPCVIAALRKGAALTEEEKAAAIANWRKLPKRESE